MRGPAKGASARAPHTSRPFAPASARWPLRDTIPGCPRLAVNGHLAGVSVEAADTELHAGHVENGMLWEWLDNGPLELRCYGKNLSNEAENLKNNGKIELVWLIEAYKNLNLKTDFFTSYFDKLAGSSKLREQIISGQNEAEIRKSWQPDLEAFKKIRKKYLLYPDFE